MDASYTWAGQDWVLRPDRTAYWPARRTLLVADPHFGKSDTFRAAGIPVPAATNGAGWAGLTAALHATGAERLVVLGDLFHARSGMTDAMLDEMVRWRRDHAGLDVMNVRGNHDRHAGDPPAAARITCVAGPWRDPREDGIAFCHEPQSTDGVATLCGHVHPGVQMNGWGGTRLRAPCFHFTADVATLPAFGAFTGLKILRPGRQDAVFAVGPGAVVRVDGAAGSARRGRPGRATPNR